MLYHDKFQVERGFTVNEPVWVCITDRGLASQSAKWNPGVVLEVCGDWWYLIQMGAVTRRVHADHLIRALDNQKMSADLGNSFEEGSCLQEFQSVPGPVGVQNQESGLPRTDEESSQSGVVPSMSGNNYMTMPMASSPVAKETEVEGHPEMTLGNLSIDDELENNNVSYPCKTGEMVLLLVEKREVKQLFLKKTKTFCTCDN